MLRFPIALVLAAAAAAQVLLPQRSGPFAPVRVARRQWPDQAAVPSTFVRAAHSISCPAGPHLPPGRYITIAMPPSPEMLRGLVADVMQRIA